MVSTYTTELRTEQQASGENSNTWGTKSNVVDVLFNEAIAGMETMSVTGGSKTLTAVNGASDESRNAVLKFTGTLVSDQTIIVPDLSKIWIIWNATSGDFTLTVKTSAGTGVIVPKDGKTFLFCDGTNVYEALSEVYKQGKETLWIPAQAMIPTITNGCGSLSFTQVSAGSPEVIGIAFDKDAIEYATFSVALPKSWDLGNVTFQPIWTANDVSTDDIIWGLEAVSVADNESIAGTYGTPQTVTDSHGGATYKQMVGSESAEITISGSPSASEVQHFRVYRDATDAGDTLDADGILIGIKLYITTNKANDE